MVKLRKRVYRGHTVEFTSEQKRNGEWIARAMIILAHPGGTKRIPIFGRLRMTFGTEREANAYAFELAKLWIEGRLWGTNGHGISG
ncbi:MAG TPA: hypothetical protein VIB79_10795 [Candidatus Binatia bacterium]